jgi:phage shock protein PspC (stress-responsive transcriptional regulator)
MTLTRSRENKWIGGVCGGLAHYFGWSATRMRIVWVLATIFTVFAGVIVYLVLWFLMPKAEPSAPDYEPAVLQPWKKH